MRKVAGMLLALSLAWMRTTLAHAVPISGLFNTGVDAAGSPLPGGSVDPHYDLILSADPLFPGPDAIVADPIAAPFWVPNNGDSQWIAPTANESAFPGGPMHPNGNYSYRLSFDLTGLDPGTAEISGGWAVDNGGRIFLNAAPTANIIPEPLGFLALVPFVIDGGFVPGINTLDFVVTNCCPNPATGVNPTGLRVELRGTAEPAQVSEPPTLLLLGSGVVWLGAVAWRSA